VNQRPQSGPNASTRLTDTVVMGELTAMVTNEQSSDTFEDATEPMTTDPMEFTLQSTGSGVKPSLSRGIGFYFQYAVLVMGIVGTTSNGLILYALIASKQHKKQVLIFNQNVLDFVSCVFLVATYAFRLCDVYLDGTKGYWLCITLWGEGCSLGPYYGSVLNLAAVTIERYLKVVHHVWAKKNLCDWMVYSTVAFTWIAGNALVAAVTIETTDVVDGICYSTVFFKSQAARMAFGITNFLFFYVNMLAIFIFCYCRILITIRRQATVMAGHSVGPGPSAAQTQSNKMQSSIIKTMMLVSGLFAISCAPSNVYAVAYYSYATVELNVYGLYTASFMAYLYMCINPFIYAIKFDPVKRILAGLIPCKKTMQPFEGTEMT